MEDKEKKVQDMYFEFQVLDQNIRQLESQLELVTRQLMELNSTSNSLEDFGKISADKEIFVPLNSGIFAKASIKDTSQLLVNVGANIIVKKDIPSTKKLIQNQMAELKKIQSQIIEELNKLTAKASQLEMQLQALGPKE